MSAQTHRLDGGRVDRSRQIEFRFNGRRLSGYAGDTLASALLANGIRVVGRSFKYHRPRGILSAGVEEPNALLRLCSNGTTIPLVRATLQPLVPGLVVTSENCWPGVDLDIARVLDFVHRLWPAGFYYKTFKWPSWRTWEGLVRRAAGIGVVPAGDDPATYFHHNLHCEVLVVGSGAAGLSAACAAARNGARVVLVEQDPEFGGQLLAGHAEVAGVPALGWIEDRVRELSANPRVRLLRRTVVAGYYDHNVLSALDQSDADGPRRVERFWRIRAREVVLATGAIEQPLVFGYNDRPGVVLAGAARHYAYRHGVAVGRRLVVATCHDEAYRTAIELHDAGVVVGAVVDTRPQPSAALLEAMQARGIAVHAGSAVVRTHGGASLRSVTYSALGIDGKRLAGHPQRIDCDALAMSGGWNPTVHLYSQAGGKVRYDARLGCIVPVECRQRVRIVGAANGEFGLEDALLSGAQAGAAAAQEDALVGVRSAPTALRGVDFDIQPLRITPGSATDRQWVDFQHDVTVADIELAVRENYVSVEHLKRYTTNGMSVDQGKTSNLNALALLGELTGREVAEVGTTTFRPQFLPITLGAIGGGLQRDLYRPQRLLPAHDWHIVQGGEFDDYGGWRRPACYPRAAETRAQAIEREVRTVRERVALFDGSPLGKIEVRGPDAARFLDRLYVNSMLSLAPGRLRYGLMLNENGIVIDDGVCACLAPDHYLLSTSSGQAERMAAWLEEWYQGEWPALEIVIAPVTTQWAVLNLVGPGARTILQTFPGDIDFSAAAFPHLNVRTGTFAGQAARVQRVSFCGELSYEIALPADRAALFAAQLMDAGAAQDIAPVGIEAWLVLRLEKGFLHIGGDTDGTTNAYDVGFGPIVERKPGDFVGKRSLLRANDGRAGRRQLVGLEPVEPREVLVAGAHLVTGEGAARRSEGFVTSACHSPTLGRSIGIGLLEDGFARLGQVVTVFDQQRTLQARVVERAFHDPRGVRMHA